MRKALLTLSLLLFVNSICFAQYAGNSVYADENRRNSNTLREPNRTDGNLKTNKNRFYAIESSVLLNARPDAYVAVFGFDQLGSTSENSNAVFDEFTKDLFADGLRHASRKLRKVADSCR